MGHETVSLIIPGRNCERTIALCLDAVVPMLEQGQLHEIIFVDDGSTDQTARIVADYAVKMISGNGHGPGAARNLGWQAATNPLIWFVDSDCIAEHDALKLLLPMMDDPKVGGASGSYSNMNDDSLLACLIHEEIIERHLAMPDRVDFLATFNVLYRKEALEKVGGFDERFKKAQDAELSFRVKEAGYNLCFTRNSRVAHFHETSWTGYLRTQRQQGYWRVWLHLSHKGHAMGDTYSRLTDHIQPPLAMLSLSTLPLLFFSSVWWVPFFIMLLLLIAQIPMTLRLLIRLRQFRYIYFGGMSFIRAWWRGVGMIHGFIAYLLKRNRSIGDRKSA